MKTLFLAWQATRPGPGSSTASRAWYPVGRLDSLPDEKVYRFVYTEGAQRAIAEAGFAPLDAFPHFDQVYEDDRLFPLFQNRLINPRRSDYPAFVERMALDPMLADPIEILALSEGRRETDHLQVFPQINARRDGSFACRFFVHGWRHLNLPSQERLKLLREDETLRVAVEMNNPFSRIAIQMQSADDCFVLGWAPRYLADDLLHALTTEPASVVARVRQVNLPPAPSQQRVLVELKGRFPASYKPMDTSDFQPLLTSITLPH